MGQYKVPQNVEAEDKIIGPLTLRQFIYAVIGVAYGFFTFSVFRGVPLMFILVGVPPTILFLALGLYQRQDQPFEALFLALVSFMVKPRQRKWEKEPIAEIFRLEAEKPVPEPAPVNAREVMGQLEKLSQLVDTRGWSAKQPEIQLPHEAIEAVSLEERIAAPEQTPSERQPGVSDVRLSDDILDFQNNPDAQNLNQLIENAAKNIRAEALAGIKTYKAKTSADGHHVGEGNGKAKKLPHLPKPGQVVRPSTTEMTPPVSDAILRLVTEDKDLKVSQVASKASRQALAEGQSVSLRNGQNRSPKPS